MKQKKIFILVLILFSLTCKLQAQKGYSISLDLKGFKDSTKFYLLDLDLEKYTDSIMLIKGRGKFTGFVKEPGGFRIHTIDNKYLVIELDNSDISVEGNYKDFEYCTIEGSELNTVWTKSRDYQKNIQIRRDSLMQKSMQINNTNPVLEKEIIQKVRQIDKDIIKYRLSLIKTEKPSFFTLKELFYLRTDLTKDSLKQLFDLFPTSLKKTKYGDVILTYIDTKGIPGIGDKFIDIEGFDLNDASRKLSENKGKYIFLEFWASWCTPCIGEIPNLIKSYTTFKDKGFEIYSFSIDSNKESWKKATEKYRITWINVSDNKGSYSVMAAKYGVRAIPKNYLINPEGTIIAMNLNGDELYKKLGELLK